MKSMFEGGLADPGLGPISVSLVGSALGLTPPFSLKQILSLRPQHNAPVFGGPGLSLLNSGLVDPRSRVSLTALATHFGLGAPFSLNATLQQVEQKTFSGVITTAGLEALGGTVEFTLSSNGSYRVHGHMHDSGAISYKYRVVSLFTAGGGGTPIGLTVLAADAHGEVEGTDKTIPFVHEPNRNSDFDSSGSNDSIRQYWYIFKEGQLHVSKAYEHAGVVGTIESAVKDFFLDFVWLVVGAGILNLPPVAGAIWLSTYFSRATGIRFLGEGGIVGLIAATGGYVLVGPTVMFPLFLAGYLAFQLGPKQRSLTQKERDFADAVFKGTIDLDLIRITDMVGLGGLPFTVPGMDGSIIINLGIGNYFDDASEGTLSDTSIRGASVKGYFFVHELTHAWDICNADFGQEGFLCSEVLLWSTSSGSILDSYKYGSASGSWAHAFNAEQRACVVADWFAGKWYFSRDHEQKDPRSPMDTTDAYFRYISGNIWLGSF